MYKQLLKTLRRASLLCTAFIGTIVSASAPGLFKLTTQPFTNTATLITDPLHLLSVAKSTLHFFLTHTSRAPLDPDINSLLFPCKSAYLDAMKKTLSFLISCIEEDRKTGKYRISNPEFLNKHFTSYAWHGDQQSARKHGITLPQGTIRLTQYLVFKVKGSPVKTEEFPHALYALPAEEKDLSPQALEQQKEVLMRFRYTKSDIIKGVYEQKHLRPFVKALAWVSRESLEEALMQGTIVVQMPHRQHHTFTVDRHNGIGYDRTLADRMQQKRYWYFKELHSFKGYDKAITIKPNVTFAGDLKHLGLGQFVALAYENPRTKKKEMRLGIIADKGGAFENNMYQLDYFVGMFENRDTFKEYISQLPAYPHAFLLIKN